MEPPEQSRVQDDRRDAAKAVLHAVRAVAYAARAVAMVLPVDERQEFWASVRAARSESAAPEAETPLTDPASVDAESGAAVAEASESSDESFEFDSAEAGSNESTSPSRWVPRDTKEVPPHLRRSSPKRTDRAEVFFFDHWDEWFTAARVGREIGQDEKGAYSTLRQLEKVRGTIHRVSRGFWSTAPSRKWKLQVAPLREAIVEALSEGRPLGTSGVVYAVKKARPDVSYGSVAAEIMRLCDQRVLVSRGHSGRGKLYGLANGGTHAPDLT